MAIIALTGQKGGVGKSTIATCLAAEALARGLRVLLVDADSTQGSAKTWAEVALENGNHAPTVVAMGAELYRPGQLPALVSNFDLVVIDCPPRHAEVQRAALMVADLALLPSGPSANDVWALQASVELVKEAQGRRPELKAAAVVTRKVVGSVLGKGAHDALKAMDVPVLRSELGFRIAYQEAPSIGLGVIEYAPTSEAAAEMRALVNEALALVGIKAKQAKRSA